MKKFGTSVAFFCVACAGLTLGVLSDPLNSKKPRPPELREIEATYVKAKNYFEVGNYEGVLEVSKKLPEKIPPRFADIYDIQKKSMTALQEYKKKLKEGTLAPTHVDRLPAALRDSYYDANIEAQKGKCRAAYDNMAPVSKYLKNRADLEIFKKCQLTRSKPL